MRLPREAQIWGLPYLADSARRFLRPAPPVRRLWVAICDHYEPFWKNTDEALADQRVELWKRHWPEVAGRHVDSTGRAPQYTFFYPQEEYRPRFLDVLADFRHRQGIGDVEIHIHHGGETRQEFIDRVSGFQEVLRDRHGLLREHRGHKAAFGFIHGNWCLDNSGAARFCGLNDEISILRDLGCYADFTMPSGGHPSQATQINEIYWAIDDPNRPKSYDRGPRFERGAAQPGGDLLMIPGPFGLLWRGFGKPAFEVGELAGYVPLHAQRIALWRHRAPRIGEDAFIKLFAHGTQERHSGPFFQGGLLDRLFELLKEDSRSMGYELRFVTAWDLYQAVWSGAV